VSPTLFAELATVFEVKQILELAVTAGWSHTVAYAIGAAGVEPETWALRFPPS
jgi:4-carboxymuconolactone decarboxylase